MENEQPIEIVVNGEQVMIREGTTIADLLEQLEMPARAIAVEVNLEIQPAAAFTERVLMANDNLEIVTLVGGG